MLVDVLTIGFIDKATIIITNTSIVAAGTPIAIAERVANPFEEGFFSFVSSSYPLWNIHMQKITIDKIPVKIKKQKAQLYPMSFNLLAVRLNKLKIVIKMVEENNKPPKATAIDESFLKINVVNQVMRDQTTI